MRKQVLVRKLLKTQGFSLLEILLAMTVAVLAMTALVAVSNTAIKSVDRSRGRTIADQYVREGVEQLRSYRDNSGFSSLTSGLAVGAGKYYSLPNTGIPVVQPSPAYVAATDPCSFATTNPSATTFQIANNTQYYRVISQYLNSATEDKVTVTVCYDYKNGKWSSDSAQTLLTNWR